jgi:glutamate-5-semialdehyde dehydrogenase
MSLITDLCKNAATAAKQLALLSTEQKNAVLSDMAKTLRENQDPILAANAVDLAAATEQGLSPAMVDRLTLNPERIEAMAQGIETLVALPDPVGETREITTRPNGIHIRKMRIPLGVICMIYEARPNVTADAGALCFKSGNGVILRGGKEALNSSMAIANVLHSALEQHGLPTALITVIPDPDRALMLELMQQRGYIDLIIPRGGEGLINFVTENSSVPVIQHFKGVCHLYVDKDADFDIAINLLLNGKTQRTGVCNALEGLLVDEAIAEQFLPLVSQVLAEKGVKVNACAKGVDFFEHATVLNDDEFGGEYLRLEIAVRVVNGIDGALAHIERFGSHHIEVICI